MVIDIIDILKTPTTKNIFPAHRVVSDLDVTVIIFKVYPCVSRRGQGFGGADEAG